MLIRKFWPPSLTSQFPVCPVPFHLDTYHGCRFNCRYCFARDFTTFHRRNRSRTEEENEPEGFGFGPVPPETVAKIGDGRTESERLFTHLEGNDPEAFGRWVERTLAAPLDHRKGAEVALKERIPLKLGANADTFPPDEDREHVTRDFLRILHGIDYPTEVQTKNPAGLARIAGEFAGANWTVAVTLISLDEAFVRVCEPAAPSPSERLRAIGELTGMGVHVMVKCQPAVWPRIMDDVAPLVRACADAGCWAFQTEGLKLRCCMPEDERNIINKIGALVGVGNLFAYYQRMGVRRTSDYELRDDLKMKYSLLAQEAAHAAGMKYFSADNELGAVGDGEECCGTEKLRGYKLWGGSCRSRCFRQNAPYSEELGRCEVNFVRNDNLRGRTVDEAFKLKEKPRGLLERFGPSARSEDGEGDLPCRSSR